MDASRPRSTETTSAGERTYFYELETLFSVTLDESSSRRRRALQSSAAPSSWQPPNLQSFGGETMTLSLWKVTAT